MGKPSLILAALAADALPGYKFVRVENLSQPGGEIAVELLTTEDNRLVLLKSPKTQAANTELGTEIRSLRILKNVSLPFAVPTFLGETSPKAIRKALAFEYVPGDAIDLNRIKIDDPIINSLGQALARIHSIPTSVVSDAGLPEYQPGESIRERVAEFDRAMDTGRIHPELLERWQNALLNVNLFRYQPTVVHGSLTSDSVLVDGGEVLGITDWGTLSVDDPAIDLSFVYMEAPVEIADAITLAYEGSIRADKNLKQRATLYSELSLASYLLQIVDSENEEELEEATNLLSNLHEALKAGLLLSLVPTEFASSIQEVVTPISQAASFTAPITIVTESIEIIDLAQVQEPARPEGSKPEEPKPKVEDELF